MDPMKPKPKRSSGAAAAKTNAVAAKRPKGQPYSVELVALDADARVVETLTISVEDYYDGSPPPIDDERYRRQRGIRIVDGRIFDDRGRLDQEFTNHHDSHGRRTGGRSVHADGTVNED